MKELPVQNENRNIYHFYIYLLREYQVMGVLTRLELVKNQVRRVSEFD